MQSNNKKPVVVGIGELLWDMLPTGKKAGGAPINFVYHASRLGAEGCAISAVGDDGLGREILEELDTLQDGVPDYIINERVAWDHLSPTSNAIDLAERADAICFGTLGQRSAQSRETIQAILSFAPDDAYRCFDINLRQHYYTKELIEESLYLANMLKVNDGELVVLRDMFHLEGTDKEVVHWFIEHYNLRLVVLTAGGAYSTIYTANEESTLQTPEVQVADTVGAGDAFSGALVISLLKGASLREAHEFAVRTAAYVCTKEGAWPAYEE